MGFRSALIMGLLGLGFIFIIMKLGGNEIDNENYYLLRRDKIEDFRLPENSKTFLFEFKKKIAYFSVGDDSSSLVDGYSNGIVYFRSKEETFDPREIQENTNTSNWSYCLKHKLPGVFINAFHDEKNSIITVQYEIRKEFSIKTVLRNYYLNAFEVIDNRFKYREYELPGYGSTQALNIVNGKVIYSRKNDEKLFYVVEMDKTFKGKNGIKQRFNRVIIGPPSTRRFKSKSVNLKQAAYSKINYIFLSESKGDGLSILESYLTIKEQTLATFLYIWNYKDLTVYQTKKRNVFEQQCTIVENRFNWKENDISIVNKLTHEYNEYYNSGFNPNSKSVYFSLLNREHLPDIKYYVDYDKTYITIPFYRNLIELDNSNKVLMINNYLYGTSLRTSFIDDDTLEPDTSHDWNLYFASSSKMIKVNDNRTFVVIQTQDSQFLIFSNLNGLRRSSAYVGESKIHSFYGAKSKGLKRFKYIGRTTSSKEILAYSLWDLEEYTMLGRRFDFTFYLLIYYLVSLSKEGTLFYGKLGEHQIVFQKPYITIKSITMLLVVVLFLIYEVKT
ncbi:hypothetical protein K502DRAFT_365080 [Neoconidiobolus thromboides FSU 785]|nr:hypothetical protein K502DRAFT_365080 [Neoconidiobolus thromboides FSU 785]